MWALIVLLMVLRESRFNLKWCTLADLWGVLHTAWYGWCFCDQNIWGKLLKKWLTSSKFRYWQSDTEHIPFNVIWKPKLPSKARSLLWLVYQGQILTIDNLMARGFQMTKRWCLCMWSGESVSHLFISYLTVTLIWHISCGDSGDHG